MPKSRPTQIERTCKMLSSTAEGAPELLERAPDDLDRLGRDDLAGMVEALDLALTLAGQTMTASSEGTKHVRDTVMFVRLRSLRRELCAMGEGVASPILQPKHAGKTYPLKTHHPIIVRLKRRAVGTACLLSTMGYSVSAAERAAVESVKLAGFVGWKLEAFRRHKRELTRAGQIEAVQQDVLFALAMGGREVTTRSEVERRMESMRYCRDVAHALLRRLMLEAQAAAAFLRAHHDNLAPKT